MLYNSYMKFLRKIVCLLVIVMITCGCSASKNYIAYTVYPIGYLLNRIGDNRIKTTSIQTNEIVQVAKLQDNYLDLLNDSMVLFRIGDLEPYMDVYNNKIKETDVKTIDLSVLNALYKYKRYVPINVEGKINYVETDYYDDPSFSSIDMYDLDPFIWLSPIGMYSMAKDINDYLTSNYVEQSEFFNENYEVLCDELIALDAAYNALSMQLVKQNKSIKFVSVSGSFGCWQKDYGFQVYPLCLSKYGALPNEKQLEIIKQKIKADGVEWIAYEPNMSDDMIMIFNEIESELGLKRVTLYNISSLTASQVDAGKDYMSMMYENLNILQNMVSTQNTAEVTSGE